MNLQIPSSFTEYIEIAAATADALVGGVMLQSNITRMHPADLEAVNASHAMADVGKGTTFFMRLPVGLSTPEQAAASSKGVRMRGVVSSICAEGVAVLLLLGSAACPAADVDVSVLERSGTGVADVVVTVDSLPSHRTVSTASTAVMDQRNRAFLPRVLVVAVGTQVEFPNNDTVSHQVYSFSDAKKFQLPLYKGERHSPVLFDRAGLVVLGCNIHDDMAGYIYVTDAQFFGETDRDGMWHLHGVPTGDYRLTVWSPFIADPVSMLSRDVHVDSQEVSVQQIRLTRPLRALPEPRPKRGDWEY